LSKTAQEKVRVYLLAKEVNVDSKQLLDYCKELGFAQVKNQLSGLETDQVDALRERIKKGPKAGSASAAPAALKQALPPPSKIENRVRTLPPPKMATKPAAEPVATVAPPVEVVEEAVTAEPEPVHAQPEAEPTAEAPGESVPAPVVAPSLSSMTGRMPNLSGRPPTLGNKPPSLSGNKPQVVPPRPTPVTPPRPATPPSGSHPGTPNRQGPPVVVPPRPGVPQPQGGGGPPARPAGPSHPYGPPRPGGPRSHGGPRTGGGSHDGPPRSGGGPRIGPPPKPGGPVKLSEDQIKRLRELSQRGQRVTKEAINNIISDKPAGGPPGAPTDRTAAPGGPARRTPPGGRPAPAPDASDDDKGGDRRRPGEVAGRDVRAKGRATTGRDRKVSTDRNAVVIGVGGSVDVIESKFGSRKGPRAALFAKMKRRQQGQTAPKKEGPVEITVPITVRSLSEAIGMKAGEVILRLKKETNALYSINSVVEFEVAELIAVEKSIQLVIKKQADLERDVIEDVFENQEQDETKLVPRPPIVTIMGHVDHGKTSLLDKIRESNVVDTETGGITQVIRAWSVKYNDKPITFLDTPGHEAFTKMRARGANVTDIAVIVVSASDGVMPQTEEAISHALAAEVKVIVAINKVDLPDANVDNTRRQLYQLNLLPDDMGGEVPFVECSAKTGLGIDKLLESILLVAELEDLKADPTRPAMGTCLEAYRDEQQGVMATVLVRNGTLHKGDVILCGSMFGRARAMYDDLGRPIDEAGPSTPVKITGLDDVPDADDPFYSLEEIATARKLAEKRKDRGQEAALYKFAPVSLENLSDVRAKAKITELKLILKAEARGSVEAIKKEMEKLVHEEVRVRILHTGIGAISESDVQLALTSPDDTLVVGFNVTADDKALKLAEQRGITANLREYDIIYKLTDDVKSALEGKLKPVEEVVHLGRAIVRDTFKISKTGTIAGCYVTSGTIERSARVRVIRDGVVMFPPQDKVIGLDSLKRFKDDAKEVREGFECGLKITGFDDVKVGDVIEAFKIEIRYRTL
jgi:translation initiation factor IF-2